MEAQKHTHKRRRIEGVLFKDIRVGDSFIVYRWRRVNRIPPGFEKDIDPFHECEPIFVMKTEKVYEGRVSKRTSTHIIFDDDVSVSKAAVDSGKIVFEPMFPNDKPPLRPFYRSPKEPDRRA